MIRPREGGRGRGAAGTESAWLLGSLGRHRYARHLRLQ